MSGRLEYMAEPTLVPPVAIYEGDTCVFPSYQFLTGSTPVNMSAWTWTCQWRRARGDAFAVNLTVDASSATTGFIYISASPVQTAAMYSAGVWDLQGVRGSEVKTWLMGTTTFSTDVTDNA